jgi:hypothetical protein
MPYGGRLLSPKPEVMMAKRRWVSILREPSQKRVKERRLVDNGVSLKTVVQTGRRSLRADKQMVVNDENLSVRHQTRLR